MEINDIRVFIPSKDYEKSKSFYRALGFTVEFASDDLSLCQSRGSTFFLHRLYNQALAQNLILQLSVDDIDEAFRVISNLTGFEIQFERIKQERWGRVIYLYGPSGEMLQLTQFNN